MKVKMKQIVQSQNAIQVLNGEKLPLKLAWRIQKNVRRITAELEDYNKINLELFKKYGEEKEPKGSGQWKLLPEKTTLYDEEIKPILEDDVEIGVQPIPLSLFDFSPDPKFPNDKYRPQPGVLLDLDWMLLDDLEVQKEPMEAHNG